MLVFGGYDGSNMLDDLWQYSSGPDEQHIALLVRCCVTKQEFLIHTRSYTKVMMHKHGPKCPPVAARLQGELFTRPL